MKWKLFNLLELIFLLVIVVSFYLAFISAGKRDTSCEPGITLEAFSYKADTLYPARS